MAIQNYAIDNVKFHNFNFAIFVENCLKIPLIKEKIRNIVNNIEEKILLLENIIAMLDDFDKISSVQEITKLEDDELL